MSGNRHLRLDRPYSPYRDAGRDFRSDRHAAGLIARKRGHPWAEAVSVGGWATLIFGFVFWPLVMIWAYVDVPAEREAIPMIASC